jgi:putative transposase
MARLARVIAPGHRRHATQRGNRRRQTFFSNADYEACLALMAEWCAHGRVEVWACCLLPNHAHLICVPQPEDSLAISKARHRYTRRVNLREGRRGRPPRTTAPWHPCVRFA